MVITAACDMGGLVECGVHEDGVEGLDEELMAVVNGWDDPKPEIRFTRGRATSSFTRIPSQLKTLSGGLSSRQTA